MRKKLISLLLVMIMAMLHCLSVGAYTRPGPTEWNMEEQYLAESENVKVSEGSLIAGDGGYVLYDYYAEIDTEKIEIHYKDAKGATITVSPEGSEAQTLALERDGEMVTYTFKSAQRRGDNRLRLDFTGQVTVTAITFHAKHYTAFKPGQMTAVLSEEEDAIATAVALRMDSPMLLVNGGRRYVDEENITLTPKNIDGSIYLPIKTLAYALGYYHEELPDKDYCLLRLEQKSFTYRNGQMVYQWGHEAAEPISVEPKLIDGTYWLPLRYFAEAIGETVVFRDGIAIADSRTYANKLISDTKLFNYVSGKFVGFTEERVAGNTYYVAQTFNADDENPGTVEAPFRTLARASEAARAGDTVIIREGVYRETLKPQHSGTEANPITFRAAEGENVTISANEVIDNFVDNGKGVAVAKLSWDLGMGRNQLFYNGDCIIEARYPNSPAIDMGAHNEPLSSLFPVKGDFMVPDDNPDIVVSDTLLNQEANYWKDAIYVSMHSYGWTLASAVVASSEPGKLNLTKTPNVWWWHPKLQDKADWGYLSGHINCMDLPGEWVIQDDVLLMLPPEGETAESLSVEMKKRQLTIDLTDRAYIRIEGINTIGGGANLKESEMCTLNRMNMRYISHFTWSDDWREGFISGYSPEALRAGKSDLLKGEVGLHLSGRDNRIINSVVDHSAGAGIVSTGLYAYIENNIVSNCGYMGSYVSGITLMNEGSKPTDALRGGEAIYNNTVYNCGRSCFNSQAAEGAGYTGYTNAHRAPKIPYELAYNDFHDGILFSLDTGITYEYCVNASTERLMTRMHNNYIYYTLPDTNPYGFGQYHDGNSTGINTWENVVFCTEKDVIFPSAYTYRSGNTAASPLWNNMELRYVEVPGGPEGLEIEHFPYGLPFYAGSRLEAEPFLRNYNNEQAEVKIYKAAEANLSEGVTIDKYGSAQLNGKGQYIEFKDVDFGETGANTADIYFRGDYFNGTRTVKLGFGESLETADWHMFTMTVMADELHQLNIKKWNFDKKTGKTNVYLLAESSGAIQIEGILFSQNDNYKDASHDGKYVNGGNFNRVDKMGGAQPQKVEDTEHGPYARDVWGGTILRYQNVTIPENAKVLFVTTGVAAPYDGGTISFSYVKTGDPSNTFIAEVTVPNNGWENFSEPQYIELDKVVPAGVVDIYVSFGNGETSAAKTCNFSSFGFLEAVPQQ